VSAGPAASGREFLRRGIRPEVNHRTSNSPELAFDRVRVLARYSDLTSQRGRLADADPHQVGGIAEVLGRRLQAPVQGVDPAAFGPLGPIVAADQPASSRYTQETLG
jgi:hypothetical protein